MLTILSTTLPVPKNNMDNLAFTDYEQARAAHAAGQLQINIGTPEEKVWKDVLPASGVFFSRPLDEYRKRPALAKAPRFFARYLDRGGGHQIVSFSEPHAVTTWLWGRDLDDIQVFKRIDLDSFDLRKIEAQLERS